MSAALPCEKVALLTLGRDICGSWDSASRYEWLVTNGLGGFACGTVSGAIPAAIMDSDGEPQSSGRAHSVGGQDRTERHYLGIETDLIGQRVRGRDDQRAGLRPPGILRRTRRHSDLALCGRRRVDRAADFHGPGANTSYCASNCCALPHPQRDAQAPARVPRLSQPKPRSAALPSRVRAAQCRVQAFPRCPALPNLGQPGPIHAAPEWYWNFWHRMEAERGSTSWKIC